jgi:hypothetical protein
MTPPFQTEPASVNSEEESQRGSRIVSRTESEQERMQKKQQQEQEDAEFKKHLDDKNLKELMQVEKDQQVEAAKKAAPLDAVKRGDMGALSPYMKDGHQFVRVNREDTIRRDAIIDEKHLRNESFVDYVKESRTPAQALEEQKKWLKETFPTQQTDAILVTNKRGDYLVESLGISVEEATAAERLQIEKRRAEERSVEVTARIQEKIKEGPQKTAALPSDQTVTALATPGIQHESPGLGSAHRG